MLAAPLMAGNDVRIMTEDIRNILTDEEVIAIDQDPLGRQGYRFSQTPEKEVWVKELSDGDWAVCVLNAGKKAAEMKVSWGDLTFLNGTYQVRDLWRKKDAGTTAMDVTQTIDSHDVALFQLSPVTAEEK